VTVPALYQVRGLGALYRARGRAGPKAYSGGMDPDRARELLAAERARIERALVRRRHVDDGEEADDIDPANLASDLYQDEFDEGLGEDLREQLAAVERAEARLAAGTYGLSIESGQPIPDERLEARPTAELTADEERARR
jgi:DnaK suppressor protein